jgi:hypothetical protein
LIGNLKNLAELKKQELIDLKEECRQEAYEYYDKNIDKLPRKKDGSFDESTGKMSNNKTDAFRHAYTSGVFTQKLGLIRANLLGLYNEIDGDNPINQQNMDLWNNAVGRKYGKKAPSKKELANLIKKAFKNKELIEHPNDPREYKGLRHFNYDPKKPVQVIKESKTGRNEYFLDFSNRNIMDRNSFANKIEEGLYPGYTIANIDSVPTPISKPDSTPGNNLG